jgi:hypothetical protein
MEQHNFLQLEEKIDQNVLNHIIKNRDTYELQMKEKKEGELEDRFTIAEKYLRLSKGGIVPTTFKQKNKIGRYSAVGSLSLQSLPKQIRHSIAGNFYYDIDIVNCHPVILEFLCKKFGFKCDKLSFFINNRDTCIGYVPTADEGAVKTAFLSILNGGVKGFNDILKQSNLDELHTFIYELDQELVLIREEFIRLFPDRYREFQIGKGDFNIEAKFVNTFLLEYENIILMKIYEYIGSPKNCVPCFDGIMVLKEDETGNPLSYDADEYVRRIKEDIGIDIKLKYKSMDNPFKFITDDFGVYEDRKTFEEIRDTPVKKRTPAEQAYFDKIIARMVNKNINILTETTDFEERKDNKYVDVTDVNQDGKIVVKAGLGKGKTTATVKHINSNDYDCIVILTPRRSYAKTTLSRINDEVILKDGLKFVLYSDIKGSINHKYIIIQVESLNRFAYDFENKKTLLVMDEVESLMYQMTSHKTHAGNHLQNLEMFERLIKESSKVLFMDAFISNKTLSVLRKMGCDFKYYNYTKELEKRTAIDLQKKNIILNKLLEELSLNKKIFFFCSSRSQITDYFLPSIKDKFPEKNIIEYHSKKSSIDLCSINTDWSKADIIICTCTITVGCNFDLPDIFNSIFVYASACSRNLVRDIFQSTYRVRHVIDKKMYFCLDERHMGLNLATNIQEIKDGLQTKKLLHTKHYEKYLDIKFTNDTPEWVVDLLVANIFESNMSIMNLKPLFYKYLELCNYTLEDIELDELDLPETEEDICIATEDYKYEDIPEITFSERRILLNKKKKEPLDDLEEFILNKSFFQATLIVQGRSSMKQTDEITLWNIYCNRGKRKFSNLQYERLDLKHSQDFGEIKRDLIVDNLEWLEENSKRFHSNFGIRNRKIKDDFTLRNGCELLGKIFERWGYSKIKGGKRKLKSVNSKRVDISNFVCDKTEDIDVYGSLEPKGVKQRRAKVRVLKEGESPL